MMTKFFAATGLALLFLSCSDHEEISSGPFPNNDNAVFDHYTVATTRTYNNSGNTNGSFLTANLQDGKYFSQTYEEFVNGEGQGATSTQHFFYENGLLSKVDYGPESLRTFYHDGQGNLIAVSAQYGLGFINHYRFVYVDANKVHFEIISRPYDDPAAVVTSRIMLEFDASDNVVKAGKDSDLDGTADWFHTFEYDAAHNLIAVHEYGGANIGLSYTPIKDNFAKIAYNTYGKKNLMVYQAECYANLTLDDLRHSPDLRQTDLSENLIEIQAAPYYFRKTKTQQFPDLDALETTVTTFYFQ